jgi:hypothetical protein
MPASDPRSTVRTIQRILLETLFIGLIGILLLGIVWELGFPRLGLLLAAVVWILGDPILEIGRLRERDGQPK